MESKTSARRPGRGSPSKARPYAKGSRRYSRRTAAGREWWTAESRVRADACGSSRTGPGHARLQISGQGSRSLRTRKIIGRSTCISRGQAPLRFRPLWSRGCPCDAHPLPSSPVRTGPDGSGVGGYDTCRAPPGQQAPVFGTAAGQRVLLVARLRGGVNRSAITAIVDGMRR